MGRVCGHRLGRPEALLEIGPSRQPAAGAGGIAEHAGGGGDLGRRLAAAVSRSPHRRLFGAGARSFGLCADQVLAPGAVSGAPKYSHLVLFPVHPTTAARYRETFCTSGAKDEPNDTAFLLDLLLRHRERLRPLQPDTVETRLLQFLVEERRRMVNERTRQSNRLTDC